MEGEALVFLNSSSNSRVGLTEGAFSTVSITTGGSTAGGDDNPTAATARQIESVTSGVSYSEGLTLALLL